MTMEWNGDQFLTDLERVYAGRVRRAAQVVGDELVSLIAGPGHPPGHKAPAGSPPGVITGGYRAKVRVVHEGLDAKIGVADYRAMFIEFGTARMPAHPHIRTALANKQQEVVDIIANGPDES